MLRRFLASSLSVGMLLASSSALAAGSLTVAADPGEPPAASAAVATPRTPTGPAPGADMADKPERVRDKTEFGAALHLLSGAAIDDMREGGLLVRPALELGVNIGLGDVGLFVGGLPLGVELVELGYKTSLAYPAMTVIGVHDDSWLVQIAGGASLLVDDSYDDHDDEERSLPSPRGEVRAGYRFLDEGMLELTAHAGVERRLFENRDDQTRLIIGLSAGIGAR